MKNTKSKSSKTGKQPKAVANDEKQKRKIERIEATLKRLAKLKNSTRSGIYSAKIGKRIIAASVRLMNAKGELEVRG
ncbi:hypothetical protein HY768_06990 [candidate division TA06 bacterium]|uniref:Uncharacterized protein n=1 Tax=candidate division TA06 bacterium TaxID=2250710 RepID=A0A933I9B0_UNCT6|nr:hypothetical protein [candidate division TA06 bacterium]